MPSVIDAGPPPTDAVAVLTRLELSDRLRHRRLETLPVIGPGAVFTEIQGRGPGESTRPAALADLISSISGCGVLQPILVEETIEDTGIATGVRRRLVLGERRLRACRWGAGEDPDNPHFTGVPAVICPGPLSDEDVRSWQLVENLAREPLQPGELAEALLLERCAMLTTRLLAAGVTVPHAAARHDDAVQRWTALQALRPSTGPAANVGAAWEDVIRRLGLHLTARKARLLVEAFRTLPRELSSDMDAHRISLTARCRYAQLFRGREHAARGLWDAVAARGQSALLPAAVAALLADTTLNPAAAVTSAAEAASTADARRSSTLTARNATTAPAPAGSAGSAGSALSVVDKLDDSSHHAAVLALPVSGDPVANSSSTDHPSSGESRLHPATADASGDGNDQLVDQLVVDQLITALATVTEQLHAGRRLRRYDTGTLALLVDDLHRGADLEHAAPRRGDGRGTARADGSTRGLGRRSSAL